MEIGKYFVTYYQFADGQLQFSSELSLIVISARSYQIYQITCEMTDLMYNDKHLGQLPIHDLIMPIMAMISTYN